MFKQLMKLFAKMGFVLVKMEGVNERVFERQIIIPHPEKEGKRLRIPAWVRIYSSIEGQELRGDGQDAIRIQAIRKWTEPAEEKILYQAKRVNRTAEESLEERIRERARECWQMGAKTRNTVVRPSIQVASSTEGPTEKQKGFFKKLTGKDFPEGFTKAHASEAIDQAMRDKGMPTNNGKGKKKWFPKKNGQVNSDLPTPAQWGFLSKLTGQSMPQALPEKEATRANKASVSKMIETAKKEFDSHPTLKLPSRQQLTWGVLQASFQQEVTA